MFERAYPGNGTFNAHAESAVRNAAELSQIQIPLESLFRQSVFVDTLAQSFIVAHALRAADDLAVTFGSEDVNAQREFRPLRIGLHVKRLDLRRVAMDHHRLFELRRDVSLVGRAEVAAPFKPIFERALGVTFLQHLYGLVIAETREWRD